MTAARHLAVAPTEAEVLGEEITAICAQIDRRLNNRPGTAERGLWFWLWPPDPAVSIEVLIRMHADAAKFLHNLTTTERTTP